MSNTSTTTLDKIHDIIGNALYRHLGRQTQGGKGGRSFFRLDGFDEETYGNLLNRLGREENVLKGRAVWIYTTEPIEGYESYALEEGKSATWYRNHLPKDHVLILIFNGRTSDGQSLDDIYPITESGITSQGLDALIQSAFNNYDLNAQEAKLLKERFLYYFKKYLFEPQLRDVAYFLQHVDEYLSDNPEEMARAIAESLPQLNLFRCQKLAGVMGSATKLRRLLQANEKASQLGREQLDDRERNKYLNALEEAELEDTPGGLTALEKKSRLRDFVCEVNVSRDRLLPIYSIDWSEVEPIIYRRKRKSKKEKLQEIARELREAFEDQDIQKEDLPDSVRDTIEELERGSQPDDSSLDSLVLDYGDNVSKRLRNRVKRLRRPPTVTSTDFAEGVIRAVISMMAPMEESLVEDAAITLRPIGVESIYEGDIESKKEELLLAFRTFYRGIESFIPSIDWQLDELWSAIARENLAAKETEKEGGEKLKGDLKFRLEVYVGDQRKEYCDLTWKYTSEGTLGATLANLLHEYTRIETLRVKNEEARLGIPLYDAGLTEESLGTIDLTHPIASLGAWYRDQTNRSSLRERFTTELSERGRPEVIEKMAKAIGQLERRWTDTVLAAVKNGLLHADLQALLDEYESLLGTAEQSLKGDQEVSIGFRLLNAAWFIGPSSFDKWGVMPPLHPLKLLWMLERLRHFGEIVQKLLTPSEQNRIVDESRLKKELETAYSSAHFPAVVALPDRNERCTYLVPVLESGGYELYRKLELAGISYGLDAALSTEEDSEQAAKVVARELTRIVEDYVDTYPFVKDGLDIFLIECRNGALPGLLAEEVGRKLKASDGDAHVNIIVHTTDRGVSVYGSTAEWVQNDEEYSNRLRNAYFPNVTLKTIECSYEELFLQVDDRDLVIIADVLSSRGQQIEAERKNEVHDVERSGYFPLYQSTRQPFQQYGGRRDVLLTPHQMPRLLRLYYNAQWAAKRERAVEEAHLSLFKKRISLADWKTELNHFHEKFNWVVCYDTSVDRHLLESTFPQAIQVIRYSTGLGKRRQHNLTVSSSGAVERIVQNRLAANLGRMFPLADKKYRRELANKFIGEAKDISGDIILRATGPGTYLNEIIGLVAAKHEVEKQFKARHSEYVSAWLFLDDYGHWFESKLPDLLFAAIMRDGKGSVRLHCEVVEAKCIGEDSFAQEGKDAQRQVAHGVNRLAQAWAPNGEHIDAPYWYHQLYQALAGNIELTQNQLELWDAFDDALREQRLEIDMSGHTWAFCHDGGGGISGDKLEREAKTKAPDVSGVPHRIHFCSRHGLISAMRELAEGWDLDSSSETWGQKRQRPVAKAVNGEKERVEEKLKEEETELTSQESQRQVSIQSRGNTVDYDSTYSSEAEGNGHSEEAKNGDDSGLQQWVESKADQLQTALRNYSVSVYPVDPNKADIGPSIVRFKLSLKPGERLSSVQRVAEDLQRELATDSVPLVDNVKREPYVGIDLPRLESAIARLSDEIPRLEGADAELPFLVGMSPSGETKIQDLAGLPHLLVAGSTGSGKTVFLYTLIVSLIQQHDPESVQLILVDPKQTDFIFFDSLPHLLNDEVIIEPEHAIELLQYLMQEELQKRTQMLRGAGTRDIRDYNRRQPKNPMPRIVVVIDEYADLIHVLTKSDRDEFERQLVRLAQRARNVGIHLVIATQRPSADIVTTRLKANLPARIAFQLPSHHDSGTILDQPGAEKLIGKGDMLIRTGGDMERLQGFFVSPEELEKLICAREEN